MIKVDFPYLSSYVNFIESDIICRFAQNINPTVEESTCSYFR